MKTWYISFFREKKLRMMILSDTSIIGGPKFVRSQSEQSRVPFVSLAYLTRFIQSQVDKKKSSTGYYTVILRNRRPLCVVIINLVYKLNQLARALFGMNSQTNDSWTPTIYKISEIYIYLQSEESSNEFNVNINHLVDFFIFYFCIFKNCTDPPLTFIRLNQITLQITHDFNFVSNWCVNNIFY